ncbi:hypothetical protein A20C1_08753 [marine actinobacterium PHSC20C1]|nr:hypothetical protein A20C1_08753 [marine actinobacterium PHSC20C1]
MQQSSVLHDEAADALDRVDRRNAVIVSFLGLVGVTIPGILLIMGDTIL